MSREGQARVLTDAEFRRVLKIAAADRHGKRNVALLYVSFGLGLRAKEMSALSICDVMAKDGSLKEVISLRAVMTKEAKHRHIFLTNSKVRAALEAVLAERKAKDGTLFNVNAPLFRSNWGERFTPNSLGQVFHRLFEAAGLDGASSHSGRRTFATRLIEKGIDIKAVAKLMGHASIAMTARYVEDNPERLKAISSEVL